jgi:hypothetical protein
MEQPKYRATKLLHVVEFLKRHPGVSRYRAILFRTTQHTRFYQILAIEASFDQRNCRHRIILKANVPNL